MAIGSTTSLAQENDLRYFVNKRSEDGSWAFPLVRADVDTLRARFARDLFRTERRAIFAEDRADSVNIGYKTLKAIEDSRTWRDTYTFGVVVGVAVAVLSAWAWGQVPK